MYRAIILATALVLFALPAAAQDRCAQFAEAGLYTSYVGCVSGARVADMRVRQAYFNQNFRAPLPVQRARIPQSTLDRVVAFLQRRQECLQAATCDGEFGQYHACSVGFTCQNFKAGDRRVEFSCTRNDCESLGQPICELAVATIPPQDARNGYLCRLDG